MPSPEAAQNAAKDDMTTGAPPGTTTPAVLRNLSFSNIHGTVTTDPPQLAEAKVTSTANPGEKHSCITLNCVGGATMENISLDNIHLTFGGGGTAEDGARRELPEIAGEYFMMGPMPAYGLYARGVRGLTMRNIRFQVSYSGSASRGHLRSGHRRHDPKPQHRGETRSRVDAAFHSQQAGPAHRTPGPRSGGNLPPTRRHGQRSYRRRWRRHLRRSDCPVLQRRC
jgi:hypothetical protein